MTLKLFFQFKNSISIRKKLSGQKGNNKRIWSDSIPTHLLGKRLESDNFFVKIGPKLGEKIQPSKSSFEKYIDSINTKLPNKLSQ